MKRRRGSILLAVSLVAVGALTTATLVRFKPRLIWNASASAPIGLYRIDNRAPELGDYVLVEPKGDLENFIVARRYLPKKIPLLKRVTALSGAEICRFGSAVFIDRRHVTEALTVDSLGRILPVWQGCISLSDDQVFLLNAPKNSLDGRYFGATALNAVIGVGVPVLVRSDER